MAHPLQTSVRAARRASSGSRCATTCCTACSRDVSKSRGPSIWCTRACGWAWNAGPAMTPPSTSRLRMSGRSWPPGL